MIKTIELMAQAFNDEDKQIAVLKQNTALTEKELEKAAKAIHKATKRKLRLIEKEYPLDKEIEKFIGEN